MQFLEDKVKEKTKDGDLGYLLGQTIGPKNLMVHKLAKISLVRRKPIADSCDKSKKLFEQKTVMKKFNA